MDTYKVTADLDALDKINASYLHQLDADLKPYTPCKPFTPSSTGIPKSYEEESKLNIGDIVAKKKLLGNYTSNFGNRYKVVVTTTINGQYGIVPVSSPFDLPMYFNREELVLIKSANKEDSFLYEEGDLVLFRYKNPMGLNKILTGPIMSRFTINKSMTEPYPIIEKYYKIKDANSCNLEYIVKESDIIEKIASTIHESNSIETSTIANPAITKTELLSAVKSIDSIKEEKPLNIKISKKQIKLNFKN